MIKLFHEGCDRGGYYEQAQFRENYVSVNAQSSKPGTEVANLSLTECEGTLMVQMHVIADVRIEPGGIVSMRTGFGGTRIVDMLAGEQLPRIC